MLPLDGLYSLYIFFNKVDFPQPFGPIIPTKLPLGTSKDISFSISFLSIVNFKFSTFTLKIGRASCRERVF